MDSTDQKTVIDESYTSPALDLLRKVLKGNGVRPDNVTVKSFDGTVLEFMAVTQIKLGNQITEKTVPGKAAGSNIFQDRQQARKAAEEHAAAASHAPPCGRANQATYRGARQSGLWSS